MAIFQDEIVKIYQAQVVTEWFAWRIIFTHALAPLSPDLKGIVHFEIHFWYVLAYLKGIQDVGVFVSAVFSILIFLGQTVPIY